MHFHTFLDDVNKFVKINTEKNKFCTFPYIFVYAQFKDFVYDWFDEPQKQICKCIEMKSMSANDQL